MLTISATSAWLVQMFDVAFSRLICCSRVARVSTNPRLPFLSTVWPAKRPGICLTNFSFVASTPQYGPPNPSGTPNDCASIATMSAVRGGSTIPRDTASAIETINSAPRLWAISAMASTSSIVPKKFGDWTRTHAVSSPTSFSSCLRSICPELVKPTVCCGRTVVHGGVGQIHPGEFGDHGLELEDRLQRALRKFGLVRCVGGEEFSALHQRVDDYGTVMEVSTGSEKTAVAFAVFFRTLFEPIDDFRLGHLARDREIARQTIFGRNR